MTVIFAALLSLIIIVLSAVFNWPWVVYTWFLFLALGLALFAGCAAYDWWREG